MTASHSCINMCGKMYDSSILACSNEWLVGNHGDWLQAPFVKNLAIWPPYELMHKLLPKDATVQNQSQLHQLNMPIFLLPHNHFKSVNLTCVWMGLSFTCMHPYSHLLLQLIHSKLNIKYEKQSDNNLVTVCVCRTTT